MIRSRLLPLCFALFLFSLPEPALAVKPYASTPSNPYQAWVRANQRLTQPYFKWWWGSPSRPQKIRSPHLSEQQRDELLGKNSLTKNIELTRRKLERNAAPGPINNVKLVELTARASGGQGHVGEPFQAISPTELHKILLKRGAPGYHNPTSAETERVAVGLAEWSGPGGKLYAAPWGADRGVTTGTFVVAHNPMTRRVLIANVVHTDPTIVYE